MAQAGFQPTIELVGRRWIRPAASIATFATVLACAGAAEAGTASVVVQDGVDVAKFTAAAGEVNQVIVSRPDAYRVAISDNDAPITAVGQAGDNGCWHPDAAQPGYVLCMSTAGGSDYVQSFEVALGDANDSFSGGQGWPLYSKASGGPGNDILHGPASSYNYSLHGGPGNDQIFLYPGGSFFWADGDEGRDTLTGNTDADDLSGGPGNDTLVGNGGDDLLSGGSGRDEMDGGDGTDTTTYDDGRVGGVSVSTGDDEANEGNIEDCGDVPGLLCGSFSPLDSVVAVERFRGTQQADTMSGGDGNDSFDGLAGDDTLTGAGGDDSLRGQDGDDTLTGGEGNDSLDGENGTDSLDGGPGADWMSGGGGVGVDVLDYSARTESVRVLPDQGPGSGEGAGAEGDEVGGFEEIRGGQAADVISAGCRSEFFCVHVPLVKGGPGGDTIETTCYVPGLCARIAQALGEGGDDTLLNEGPHPESMDGGPGADTVTGGSGVDTIDGGTGVDDLDGGGGADTLLSRDSAAEAVACGPDGDRATTDAADTVDADCEDVAFLMLAAPSVPAGAVRGTPLTANPGTWFGRPLDPGQQWQRCTPSACTDIPGETSPTYTPVLADVDHRLKFVVTLHNVFGTEVGEATTNVVTEVAAGGDDRPTPPGTDSPGTTPADTRTPSFTMSVRGGKLAKLRARGLAVGVSPQEAGRLTVTLSLPRSLARRLGIGATVARTAKRLTAAAPAKLTLRLTRRARRALGRVQRARLTLRVALVDAAGNASKPQTRTLWFR
jgi:Ca2+-binding RTX toxin-like protein